MPTLDLSARAAAAGGSAPLHGYLARPAGPGPWPGVVLVHEIFGLDPVMRRQADRLAAAGYLTLAPDLYSAGGARRCVVATMRAMTSGRGRALADIAAAQAELRASAECTGRIGIIGFCMGGAFALLTASQYDVAAPNYGRLPKDAEAVLASACPIVASYGGRDPSLRGAAARLETALSRLGVTHDVKEYPGAGHAFLNDEEAGPRVLRPLLHVAGVGPEPEAAADAWRRIEAYFARYLR